MSMTKKRQLITIHDFERMRIFTRKLDVFQEGELIDTIIIQSHDDEVVLATNGDRFMKENCVFIRA